MKRILLEVAYDGTNYCGWQMQKEAATIEGELNKAVSSLTGEDTAVIGASRTDAGVHALGNVAVFDTESSIPPEKFAFAINQRLPEDIRVQSSYEVPGDFHPRHVKCIKTYEYRILNRQMPLPCRRLYSYFYHGNLDVDKMQKAADYLVGTHDFTSFCCVNTAVIDKVRTVTEIKVLKDGDEIILRVVGTGFLYNMVRIIAGTLLQAGKGSIEPEAVRDILDKKDRRAAGPTAPARGLWLVGIRYGQE